VFDWLAEVFSNPYVLIVLLTFAPFLELRASIPYGVVVLGKENWPVVCALAVVTNILLGPILYFVLEKFLHLLLKVKLFDRIWQRSVVRTQKKIHPLVEKYGVWGLGFFIGIPLPGSGVYSGSIGGYLLGFTRKEFYIATVVGVLMAAIIVTIISVTGAETFDLFLKKV